MNKKLSVAVFTVLSTLMLQIPIIYCLKKRKTKVNDNDFRRNTNEGVSEQEQEWVGVWAPIGDSSFTHGLVLYNDQDRAKLGITDPIVVKRRWIDDNVGV